jgi:hypothetical protein
VAEEPSPATPAVVNLPTVPIKDGGRPDESHLPQTPPNPSAYSLCSPRAVPSIVIFFVACVGVFV